MKTLWKRIVTLTLMLMLCIPMFSHAASSIRVKVNGQKVDFSGDQEPYIDSAGRTLVPVRKVFEKLGSDVRIQYIEDKKMVVLTKGITNISLIIGNPFLTIAEDGKSWAITMDTVPVIKNGRTMLPARAIAEALGAKVAWNAETRTVSIDADYKVVGGFAGNAFLSKVTRDNLVGCIDKNRKIVVPIEYDSIDFREFSDAQKDDITDNYNNAVYAVAKATKTENGKTKTYYLGIAREHINGEGKTISAHVDIYDYAEPLPGNKNYLCVCKKEKWGVIAISGEPATAMDYEEQPILMTSNGKQFLKVKKNGKFGISTLDNKMVADPEYITIGSIDFSTRGNPVTYYQEGYVCARRFDSYGNSVAGYLDEKGNEIDPFNFIDVQPFENGKATVFYNGEERRIQINSQGDIWFISND